MSHKTFSRILNDQSNKLLPSGNVSPPSNQNLEIMNNLPENKIELDVLSKSMYYNILGYELSFFTIVIILILLICVIYLLYKYFFTKSDIVSVKKYSDINQSKKKNKFETKNETKNEIKDEIKVETDTDDSSLNSLKKSEVSSSSSNNSSK
jgi:hypothetical protein